MESANENANGVDGGQPVVHNGGSTVARVNYGGRINLTHELLRLIKSNDPNVTELEADFSLGSTFMSSKLHRLDKRDMELFRE